MGDVTNNGGSGEYDTLMDIINGSHFSNTGDDTKTILAMGNHEFNNSNGAIERFESKTGQDNTGAYYFYKNGNPERAAQNELAPYIFALEGSKEKLTTMHINFTVSGSEEGMFLGRKLESLNGCTLFAQQESETEDGSVTYDAVMGYLPGTEETIAEDIDDVLKLSVRTAADKTGSVSVKLNSIEFNSGVTGEISSSADLVTTFVSNMYDVNSDGKLDLDDVAAVQALYRAESGEEQWNAAADLNADGVIDLSDIVEIAKAYLRQ